LKSDIAQTLRTRVGNVVEVNEKFIAPTLWGSTSSISDEVVHINDNVDTLVSEFAPLKSLLEEVAAKVEESREAKYPIEQIVGIVSKMMQRIKEMFPEIAQLKQDVSVLVKGLPQSPPGSTIPPSTPASAVDDSMRMMGSSGLLQDGS
jgi:transcriptional regulator with PAS, ATPase and Fis domain